MCQSIRSEQLPTRWKEAWVTPIFKKGSRNDPANYRPVSLTCIVCKLTEHIICTHLRGHLDRHGILTPTNHGFRSGHSCESQLLLTTHDLMKQRDLGHKVDVGILDFSKAFDTVPHKRLINKLKLHGAEGCTLGWIADFLKDREQQVLVDGAKSEQASVASRVPKGYLENTLLKTRYTT